MKYVLLIPSACFALAVVVGLMAIAQAKLNPPAPADSLPMLRQTTQVAESSA